MKPNEQYHQKKTGQGLDNRNKAQIAQEHSRHSKNRGREKKNKTNRPYNKAQNPKPKEQHQKKKTNQNPYDKSKIQIAKEQNGNYSYKLI